MSQFIHLRVYSDYSLGEGAIKIGDLAGHCANSNIPAVALTDKYNMFASLEFSGAAIKKGVQPIVGTVINVVLSDSVMGEVLLIATDKLGMENLFKISTHSYLYSEDISVSIDVLNKYKEGLIFLCGNAPGSILTGYGNDFAALQKALLGFKHIFAENFYIEINRDGTDNSLEQDLLRVAAVDDIAIVATNSVAFLKKEMQKAQDTLLCITKGRYLLEDNRPKANPEYYFKTSQQMQDLFADLPEAIENTVNIAKKCHVYCESNPPLLPSFTSFNDEDEELTMQATQGLKKRLTNVMNNEQKAEYFERLEYELSVIKKMKYSGYFLIVSDFIRWSKSEGIPVGPGRGSGAGSVVAWALEITDPDPLRFGLLFERFLNPERISMPDFDIDFCQHRRDEVIEYVRNKYGHDKVAQIITFGKLQARAVLRDVGRVLQMPYNAVDKICKMVPNNPANPVTLSQAINLDKDLQDSRDSDPDIAELLSISLQLEGMNRHVSTHAAGVVIADRPIEKITPLYKDKNSSMPAVQYSMKYAEEAGLVKFDFLGLKTLTLIADTCALITDEKFDITTVPLDDNKTYDMLSRGDTVGVFQFDGSGMKEVIKKFKPDIIEDLVALTSLYRPGPMDSIPSYIARKHGQEESDYIHPKLAEILKETHGIIVYQEQVMEIAKVLAGYTLGSADILRRAMGKKIKSEMDKQRKIFIDGCVNNGILKEQASDIFALVAKFASYGFNKSHAVAYSIIAYQTAYLKANYPLEFFTASINLEIDDSEKINTYLQDLKRLNIKMLPPDINKSSALFKIEDNAIRFGLGGIKNVGIHAIKAVVKEREQGGEFKTIFDVVERCSNGSINKKMLENMAKARAFINLQDSKEHDAKVIYENSEVLIRYGTKALQEKQSKQTSLFGSSTDNNFIHPSLEINTSWQYQEALEKEFEALGFYYSSHPLESYSVKLAKMKLTSAVEVAARATKKGVKLAMAGVILSRKIRSSARGKYAFLQLSDPSGIFEASIFDDKLLYEVEDLVEVGCTLYLEVNAKEDENGLRIMIENLRDIKAAAAGVETTISMKIKEFTPELVDLIIGNLSNEGRVIKSLSLTLHCGSEIFFNADNDIYRLNDNSLAKLRALSNIEVVEY